ncbi:hypothetical protein A4R89_00060 [Acetobacter ascendens]|nr:hypothetical protein A4R89_00060 [Acetobacter ascendens]
MLQHYAMQLNCLLIIVQGSGADKPAGLQCLMRVKKKPAENLSRLSVVNDTREGLEGYQRANMSLYGPIWLTCG